MFSLRPRDRYVTIIYGENNNHVRKVKLDKANKVINKLRNQERQYRSEQLDRLAYGEKRQPSEYVITTIIFGNGIKTIPKEMCNFEQCKSMLKICVFPEDLEEIGDYAFQHTALKSIVMPPTLRYIGNKSFYTCTDLKEIRFNNGLEGIGDEAFEYCWQLLKPEMPSTLTFIGNNALPDHLRKENEGKANNGGTKKPVTHEAVIEATLTELADRDKIDITREGLNGPNKVQTTIESTQEKG